MALTLALPHGSLAQEDDTWIPWRGVVRERNADGSMGAIISGAEVGFASEDGSVERSATSDAQGRYQLQLKEGRYRSWATADGYERSESPGWSVIQEKTRTLHNFFLRKKPQ